MKHKRFLSILSLSFLAACSLASCGGGDEPGPGPDPDPDPTPTEPTVENPLVVDEITADSEGIKLVAPFTIIQKMVELQKNLNTILKLLILMYSRICMKQLELLEQILLMLINYKFKMLIIHKFLFVKKPVTGSFLMDMIM